MDAHLIQGSPEWISWKKNKISGTDCSKILGTNPWTTAYSLWQEKLGLIEPQKMNSNMQRGVDLEPIARKLFNEITNNDFEPIVLEHKTESWAIASLDGMNSKGEILEIKANGKKNHDLALEGIIPEYYMCQLQHCLWVSNAQKAYYFSYTPESHKIIEVKPDLQFIEYMVKKEKEFFKKIMEFDPPPLCDRDYVQKDDKEWRMIAHLYNESSRELEICKARNEALRQELIKMSGGQSCKGGGITLTKSCRLGGVKYDSIPALKSVNLNDYRKPSIEIFTIREDKNGI